MKKFVYLLLSIGLLLALTACSKKTTIDSKEEWEALFDIANYEKAMVEERGVGSDEQFVITMTRDNNLLKVDMKFDDDIDTTYIEIQENENYIRSYSLVAADIYGCVEETHENYEEVKEIFDGFCKNYLLFYDYSDQYENIEYDSEKKCYFFDYDMYEEYPVHAEVYVVNGLLEKIVIIDDEEYGTITSYNYVFKDIETPTINSDIKSKEEWTKIFTKDRYTNCTVNTYDEDKESVSYINDNVIGVYEYLIAADSYSGTYYVNDSNTNTEKKLLEVEDGTLLEDIISYDDNIKEYSDRLIAYTVGVDYSEDYDSLNKVDSHYELVKNDKTIKFYISDNYLYKMTITDSLTGKEENKEFYGYGTTYISDPTLETTPQE